MLQSIVRRRVALGALLLGTFMGVLDVFVVTVALPAIRAELGASFGQTQLVIAGYAMAYAVGLITGGRLGDLYGRRRLFVAGGGAFVGASVACGAAQAASVLIAARIVQGLAAAAMLPQVLSIIRAGFPDRERSAAVGWYGAVIGLGAACGPGLGGLLVAADVAGWGWRWVFLVNVPVGVAALVGVARTVNESRADGAARLDGLGAGLLAVGLVASLVPLTRGAEAGWPAWMIGSLAASPPLLAGFVGYERRLERLAGAPLLPVGLLANRAFTGGLGVVLALYAGDALFLVLTYHLQDGLGRSPASAGILLAPVGLGFAVASAIAPRLVARARLLVPAIGIVLIVARGRPAPLVRAGTAGRRGGAWACGQPPDRAGGLQRLAGAGGHGLGDLAHHHPDRQRPWRGRGGLGLLRPARRRFPPVAGGGVILRAALVAGAAGRPGRARAGAAASASGAPARHCHSWVNTQNQRSTPSGGSA